MQNIIIKARSDRDPLTYVTFGMFQTAYKKMEVGHHIHSSTTLAANITYPANNDSSQAVIQIWSCNKLQNKIEAHLQIW